MFATTSCGMVIRSKQWYPLGTSTLALAEWHASPEMTGKDAGVLFDMISSWQAEQGVRRKRNPSAF
jgi:hypothetical protein